MYVFIYWRFQLQKKGFTPDMTKSFVYAAVRDISYKKKAQSVQCWIFYRHFNKLEISYKAILM